MTVVRSIHMKVLHVLLLSRTKNKVRNDASFQPMSQDTCIYYCEAKLSSYHLISNQECTNQYLDESLLQSKSTRCARSLGWGETLTLLCICRAKGRRYALKLCGLSPTEHFSHGSMSRRPCLQITIFMLFYSPFTICNFST